MVRGRVRWSDERKKHSVEINKERERVAEKAVIEMVKDRGGLSREMHTRTHSATISMFKF